MKEKFGEIPFPEEKMEVDEENKHFKGVVYVFEEDPSGLLVATAVDFDVKPAKPLDSFRYIKPLENPDNPFDPPIRIDFDQEPRVGYYPLHIIERKVRRPQHLDQADSGIFTAVKGLGGNKSWVIRYFPSGNIDPFVIDQARRILDPKPQIS